MKTLNKRWRLIALVPLVVIAILSIGNRTEALTDQWNSAAWQLKTSNSRVNWV